MTSEQFDNLVARLNGQRRGDDYLCFCPAHVDDKASLSLKLKPDGKILVHCFAGCSYDAISPHLQTETPAMPTHKPKLEQVNKVPTALYKYHSKDGTELFEKLRFEPKDFRIRHKQNDGSYVYKLGSVEPELYHADKLAKHIEAGHIILVCEGEKDVDNVNRLKIRNIFATTNFEGAAKWRNTYTQALIGAKIIIVEDNDAAGQARTKMLCEHLAQVALGIKVMRFTELDLHSDISDYLGISQNKNQALREKISEAEIVDLDKWRKAFAPSADKERAAYDDYVSLIKHITPDIRRCALSGKLMTGSSGSMDGAENLIRLYRSYARQYPKFFSVSAIEDHLIRLEQETQPELLVTIPTWDGVDRLKEACSCFQFANVTQQQFYELILFWGSTMFRRLVDETIQPVTPIIQGPQGVGKDVFIEALVGAFKHYRKDLSFATDFDVREALKKLHTAVVFVIAEFDRVAKVNQGFLKSILNRHYTDERLSYDRTDKQRKVRCSFIASCNTKSILTDAGANRRYWYFEAQNMGLELVTNQGGKTQGTGKVLKSYPGLFGRPNQKQEQEQYLAQFKAFAELDYRPSEHTLETITMQMLDLTPDSMEDFIINEYDTALLNTEAEADIWEDNTCYYSLEKIDTILGNLAKNYGVKRKWLLSLLKRENRSVKKRAKTFYFTTTDNKEIDESLLF